MNYSLIIAQLHHHNDADYVQKITKIFDHTADLTVNPVIPRYDYYRASEYLSAFLDLTVGNNSHLLLDGRYHNLPGCMLLIAQGKILMAIPCVQSIDLVINGTKFHIAFDMQDDEDIKDSSKDIKDAVNIHFLTLPYPAIVKDIAANTIYVNPVGGYGELVYMGQSYVTNMDQQVVLTLKKWQDDVQIVNGSNDMPVMHCREETETAVVYQALVVALRDYVNDNGFAGVMLGLSGGIDSALSMVLATDALGQERVHTIMMPSRYTSDSSVQDASDCVKRLGVRYDVMPIEKMYTPILDEVKNTLQVDLHSLTQENIQARIRGLILMTMSNQLHKMVLATGNKSEAYTGYCTLYGDTCGGYAILKDIYKTQVYALSHWRNANIPDNSLCDKLDVIPSSILHKAPTAELRFNQKDNDSLPDYEILDGILEQLIDQNLDVNEIINDGYDAATVKKVVELVMNSEYKRQQAPVGPMVSCD